MNYSGAPLERTRYEGITTYTILEIGVPTERKGYNSAKIRRIGEKSVRF